MWKVETIGDSFMVASGLNVAYSKEEDGGADHGANEVVSCHVARSKVDHSRKRGEDKSEGSQGSEISTFQLLTVKSSIGGHTSASAAAAAIKFGQAALKAASL